MVSLTQFHVVLLLWLLMGSYDYFLLTHLKKFPFNVVSLSLSFSAVPLPFFFFFEQPQVVFPPD